MTKLEIESTMYACERSLLPDSIDRIKQAFEDGANWQKKQLLNELAHMSLDEAIDYIVKGNINNIK